MIKYTKSVNVCPGEFLFSVTVYVVCRKELHHKYKNLYIKTKIRHFTDKLQLCGAMQRADGM